MTSLAPSRAAITPAHHESFLVHRDTVDDHRDADGGQVDHRAGGGVGR